MFSLSDKIAIITGASSGIGLATARLFLDHGAVVHGVDVSPAPSTFLESPKFQFQRINLRQPGSADDVVAHVDTLDPAQWDPVIAINLTAPAFLCKAVVNVFKKHPSGGSIVNVSSKARLSGGIAGAAYTSNKHGLNGLTKNIAWRFHDEGIRCNAICPGGFVTGITNSISGQSYDEDAMKVMG
ncbi:hypothetical protein BDW75DRAFT_229459 [Aspergillus navahoensis]